MVVEGCPALTLDDESILAYRLFFLAHSPIPTPRGTLYLRQMSFSEALSLPNWLTEAFQVIESELRTIQVEK